MTKIENRINTPKEVQEYFESIKGNHVALRQFFTAMPKGGDVHNPIWSNTSKSARAPKSTP